MNFRANHLKILNNFSFLLIIYLLQVGCVGSSAPGGEVAAPAPISAATPERPATIEVMGPVGFKVRCFAEASLDPENHCNWVTCTLDEKQDPRYQCDLVSCTRDQKQDPKNECDLVECTAAEAFEKQEDCDLVRGMLDWKGPVTDQSFEDWLATENSKNVTECRKDSNGQNLKTYTNIEEKWACCSDTSGKAVWSECPKLQFKSLDPPPSSAEIEDWFAQLNNPPPAECPRSPSGDLVKIFNLELKKWACCTDSKDTGEWGSCEEIK